MGLQPDIDIYFYLDGKVHGSRRWFAVPRIGDLVLLNYQGNMTAFSIIGVVWGVESDHAIRQEVNIEVEHIKENMD